MRARAANANARARVSKDDDETVQTHSCFEEPRHSASKTRVDALKARLLSMRAGAGRAVQSGETNPHSGRARPSHREPTCTCTQVRSIVVGLLFTMKIPTQTCDASARGGRITQHSHSSLLFIPPAKCGKFASGLRFGLLGQAPELKSFGADCLLDRVARELMRRSLLRPDGAGGGPRTQLLWKPAAREIAREGLQTFPRLRFENIKPHDSTLSAVNDGYVCVAGNAASAARASSAQPS
jgi:hypothetical protein